MKSFKIKIPPKAIQKDLTVVYEDDKNNLYKITVSKKEFFDKLQYFENKRSEINQTNMIYIQENIDVKTFREFISSISNPELDINENNYDHFLYLSHKYEYKELEEELQAFIEKRPDISIIIDELSANKEEPTSKAQIDIDYEKEKLIAKHLDICLTNKSMKKMSIEMLNRIFNSPDRILKNHHLLFSFIINLIDEKKKGKLKPDELESLYVLTSSLDYLEMSNSELEKLFLIEDFKLFFKPKNSDEKMKILIEKEDELNKKCEKLEEEMKNSEEKYKFQIDSLQQNQKKLEQAIQSIKDEFDKRINKIEKHQQKEKTKMITIESKIDEIAKNKAEKARKMDEFQIKIKNTIPCPEGIIEHLRQECNGNIYEAKVIGVNTTSINSGSIKRLFDKSQDTHFRLDNQLNGFIILDFKEKKINFSKYYFSVPLERTGNCTGRPKSWEIEGSNDQKTWDLIDKKENDFSLAGYGLKTQFTCQNITNKYYRFISIKEIINHNNNHYFLLSEVEFYGSIQIV